MLDSNAANVQSMSLALKKRSQSPNLDVAERELLPA
jgi:hypothetical protein